MITTQARFGVGQTIYHKAFHYRGVIVDVDPQFQGTDEWYEQMALSRPPKDNPWYHVLVHDMAQETYVAERNLEVDVSGDPVQHPAVSAFFSGFKDGMYVTHRATN